MNSRFKFNVRIVTLGIYLTIFFISTAMAENQLHVTASILPQKYFINKIAGDRVKVNVMVLPGANPETYEPRPEQMRALTKTAIYFAIGVPFETIWLKRFADANPKMVIIHTEDGVEMIPLRGTHRHTENEHLHEGIKDPHIWLSPLLVIMQVRNIYQALSQIDPSHAQQYRNNYETFLKELKDLDQRIKQIFLDNKQGAPFLVYHPSWGYFAKAYGLVQLSIEVEGKEPSPRALKDLIEYARERDVKAILVQPQFSMKSAQTVAKAIDAQVIIADPLDSNWADNLLHVAEKIRQALI